MLTPRLVRVEGQADEGMDASPSGNSSSESEHGELLLVLPVFVVAADASADESENGGSLLVSECDNTAAAASSVKHRWSELAASCFTGEACGTAVTPGFDRREA